MELEHAESWGEGYDAGVEAERASPELRITDTMPDDGWWWFDHSIFYGICNIDPADDTMYITCMLMDRGHSFDRDEIKGTWHGPIPPPPWTEGE